MIQAFDKKDLLDELDGDREFLEESLEMFDQDAPKLLATIRDALGEGNADAVHVGAHTLKSMVGNFCAQPAFDVALKIETLGRQGDLASCQDEFKSLENEVNRLNKELHDLLNDF